jgi:hypothetical protein
MDKFVATLLQLSGKSKVNAAYGRIVLLLYWQQYNAILILFIQHYYTLFNFYQKESLNN